jgi:hypothetical protein
MPINLNQLNTNPLASVAGATTHNLGLAPYGINVGTVNQGIAAGQMEALKLKQQQQIAIAHEQAQLVIQQMKDQGLINRTQAQLASAKELEKFKQANLNLRQASVNEIGQQNADTNRLNAGINMQNSNVDAAYKQGMLGYKGQELDQTKAFQQGTLGIQQQNVDINKQKAEQEAAQKQLDMALKLDDRKAQQIGMFSAAAGQILSNVKDPVQQKAMLDNLMNQADENGLDTSKFRKMNPQQLSIAAANGVMMSHVNSLAKEKAAAAGMQLVVDDSGNPVLKPLEGKKETPFKQSYTDIYTDASKRYDTIGAIKPAIQESMLALKSVPEWALGPLAGLTGAQKVNPAFQQFNTKVQAVALSIKDALFHLGGGQGFSNMDAERLNAIADGGLLAYKGSAKEALNFLDRLTGIAQKTSYATMDKTQKLMSSSEDYQKWKELYPDPSQEPKKEDPLGLR